jgi:tetratricopeptide (TPR) repeat protein
MQYQQRQQSKLYCLVKLRLFGIGKGLRFVVLLMLGLSFFANNDALGQTTGTAASGLLSDRVSRQLVKAQKFSDNNQYKEAQKLLENLIGTRLNDYEAAVVYQTLGYVYASLEDYSNTALAFEKSLSYGELSKLAEQSLRLNLGQIYISLGSYAKGTDILEKWLALEPSGTSQVHELLAVGYYHLDNFQKAEVHLERAIATTNQPNKTWYQMLVAVNFAQSDYRGAADVLRSAIQHFPKDKLFWQQLSYAFRQLEEDEKALTSLILADYFGLLNSDEAGLLAKYYIYQKIPIKAAQLVRADIDSGKLDASVDNLLLLARSWLQAREPEQAAAILKSVTSKAPDGKHHVFYAEVLTELRHWPAVVETLTTGFKKGGIENSGHANLLLGIAYFHLEKFLQAKQAFNQALQDNKTKVQARQWLDQIERTENN